MTPRAALTSAEFQDRASCLDCGYALRGLAEWRCPECGREFCAFDPNTMNVPGVSRKPPPKPVPFAFAIILCALIMTLVTWPVMLGTNLVTSTLGAAGWVGVFYLWRRRNRDERAAAARGEPLGGTRLWRPVVVALFVLMLITGFDYRRCPHGRYYRYGPVALFRDHSVTRGGPCRNYMRGTRFELAWDWHVIVS